MRIGLRRGDTGGSVDAEITREHYRALVLQGGNEVHIAPRTLTVGGLCHPNPLLKAA